jgi:hypothetical protein
MSLLDRRQSLGSAGVAALAAALPKYGPFLITLSGPRASASVLD